MLRGLRIQLLNHPHAVMPLTRMPRHPPQLRPCRPHKTLPMHLDLLQHFETPKRAIVPQASVLHGAEYPPRLGQFATHVAPKRRKCHAGCRRRLRVYILCARDGVKVEIAKLPLEGLVEAAFSAGEAYVGWVDETEEMGEVCGEPLRFQGC